MSRFQPGRHGFDDYRGALRLQVDVCVVGAGAGGGAAAARLAEAGLRVAVMEEGRHWNPSAFREDTAFAFKNLYQGRGARSLRGNVVMPLPGGRGVGGSTLINSAIAFRTPEPVLEEWRSKHGLELATPERFGRYFDRIWQTLGVTVNPLPVQRNNNLIFKLGADRLGLDGHFLARSAPGCVGCGICQYGCPTGGKASVDRTFLAEAVETGQVGIYADCRIRGVETRGDRVLAVTGTTLHPETQEPVETVRVEAETFLLAGGPVGSPLFLLANGLSDATHCGRHLVVHPCVSVLARFPQEIRPWSGVTQGFYVDCWDRGFLLQTYTVTPDQYFLLLQTDVGEETMRYMADLAHVASAGALVHDEDSEGRVKHTPLGPDLTYTLGEGDKRRLIEGMRLASEVYFAAGAEEVLPAVVGVKPATTMAQVRERVHPDLPPHWLFPYASHPMGTCRMGADPERSVVDPHGRVWGWSNLRVADASVFPTSLGVNPQVTTMAMGLMVAESLVEG